MATYKVLQDIEAEDKILGPLTLRQFIYALVAAFCGYLSFIVIAKGVSFLLAIFLPPGLFFAFLAFPFGKDQPTEVWALAKLRFFIMPRRRLWNQSGVKELVTITVPKKIEPTYTNRLSETEVQSRLKALANTIDSRGWAIKNVDVSLYRPPSIAATSSSSDRLIDINSIPQAVPDYDIRPDDDMLDEANNPVAQQVEQMIDTSTQTHRQELMDELNTARAQAHQKDSPANYWFANPPRGNRQAPVIPADDTTDTAQTTDDEAQATASLPKSKRAKKRPNANSHLRTIRPLGATSDDKPAGQAAQNTGGKAADPAILELAKNNDLNVSTLARQAKKAKGEEFGDSEVVISLH